MDLHAYLCLYVNCETTGKLLFRKPLNRNFWIFAICQLPNVFEIELFIMIVNLKVAYDSFVCYEHCKFTHCSCRSGLEETAGCSEANRQTFRKTCYRTTSQLPGTTEVLLLRNQRTVQLHRWQWTVPSKSVPSVRQRILIDALNSLILSSQLVSLPWPVSSQIISATFNFRIRSRSLCLAWKQGQ